MSIEALKNIYYTSQAPTKAKQLIAKHPYSCALAAICVAGVVVLARSRMSQNSLLEQPTDQSEQVVGTLLETPKSLTPLPSLAVTLPEDPAPCTPRIVHLAQTHRGKGMDKDLQILLRVWNSQKNIAAYLLQHPNAIVFSEACFAKSEYENLDALETAECQLILGNKKLPKNLENLNHGAKCLIALEGAEHFLHKLGKVRTLYPCITQKKNEEISTKIDKEYAKGNHKITEEPLRSLICDDREEALVKEVHKFLRTTKEKSPEIVIIYGARHNFNKYFSNFNFTRINTTNDPRLD